MTLQRTRRALWGIGTPRTMRPHWALHELSLSYETRPVRSRMNEADPAFTKLNPRRKIPVLQDDEIVISESAAIIAYLSDAYPVEGRPLVPTCRLKRARWMEWCPFIMTELDATSLYVIRRHRDLQDICGQAPAAVDCARSYFTKQLAHVDEVLKDGSRYLMGENFTTADILLTTCLDWAISLQIPLYESCTSYRERMAARDAYRSARIANDPSA